MRFYQLLFLGLFTSFVQANTIEYPKLGFSIETLDSSLIAEQSIIPIQMLLPAKNNFSANVNVIIQPYKGTINEYKVLSLTQFEQLGLTLNSVEENANVVTFDYSGDMNGNQLHWYAKAHKKGEYIYLITATGLASDWESDKQQLIDTVNSFKLK